MSHSLRRALLALVAVLALAFTVAACGSDDKGDSSSSTSSSSGGGSKPGQLIKADPANKGKKLTVGSKNFAEQFILGEIYSQALQASGFTVKKQLDLGSEQIAFKAVKSGDVDMYPEYSGTALTSFYHVTTDKVPRDKDEAFNLLKKDAAADKITTLPQTPFQNTFVITSTKKTADALGNPKTISDLATKAGSSKSISGFPECKTRTDCLVGLKNVYKWTPKFVSSEGKFDDLDKGQADFTFGFGTDGELSLDKYATYQDDKQLFPPYYITLMTRNDAVEKLGPSGQKVIQDVQKPLTEEVMQELNSRVTIDKQEPKKVAHDYLKESGFIN
jgi:glycine betaine/choline ABC-type transport system substrate-binding protein